MVDGGYLGKEGTFSIFTEQQKEQIKSEELGGFSKLLEKKFV